MATLNLDPDPIIIAGQSAFFVLNLLIVNKLFIQPYLGLKQARRGLTSGKLEQTKAAIKLAEKEMTKLDEQLRVERSHAQEQAQKLISEAQVANASVVEKARKDAQSVIMKSTASISELTAQEMLKVEQLAKGLVDEVYTAVSN